MFRNYLKTAIRSLIKHRFFSLINIFGLAVSMAICMAIMMLVADQLTYDRFNSRRDRIYRVNSIPMSSDGHAYNETATTTIPLHQELLANYTGIESAVRVLQGFGNHWMEIDQDVNVPVSGYFVDANVFDFFQYELEYGDPKTALVEPNTVVLTKKAARKLFSEENPVGQLLQVRKDQVYKVTGVLKENGNKSHVVFDALASISTLKPAEHSQLEDWYQYTTGWVYVMLAEGRSKDEASKFLDQISKKHFSVLTNPDTQQKINYNLQAITGITPGPFINNPIGPFLPWIFIYFFAGLGGIVMLTSCFNFTNLSIARSLTRAREIGIRKVTGAIRWQVFSQFIVESVLVALFALLLAFAMLVLLKPMIMQLNFAKIMHWGLEENYYVYGMFVLFAVFVGILAGMFPAIILSGFQPIKVLKNLNNLKLFSKMGLRKALLVVQFTFSLIFILTVIVVFNQLNLFLKADHGFKMEGKAILQINNTSADALKHELLKYSNIETVAGTSHLVASGNTRGESYKRQLDDKEWRMLCFYAVDEDYLKSLEIGMVAGKFYEAAQGASNKNFIVINELAASDFGFKSPQEAIGEDLIVQGDSSSRRIIGVVKNYSHKMLMEKSQGLVLAYQPDQLAMLQVSYKGTYREASKSIEAAWKSVNPSLKVDYKDFSEEVHKMYNILFGDLADILAVISFLAILISSLGLLGMATYSTETRKKEISIRKILGSGDGALIYLLSKGFVVILVLAVLIAVPIAYFANNLWLQLMEHHVSVDLYTVALGILVLVVFGIVTIGSQTWRATFVNPVESLKGE